ncbi:hypothetical protein M426DRAFT_16743 [Hypoxylon sp. CI-4A]|nr:hypothetical protein M426DRAFT_16743 [Hypoxylon sp. CI-4A]
MTPLRQLYPDPTSEASNVTQVDIIAVHGLATPDKNNAEHALNTWRASDGHLWIHADLPKHFTHARVFFYNYNAVATYYRGRDAFVHRANDLLEAIRLEREDTDSRPILFLGHSLGGLLIKQALVNAYKYPKYTSIKDDVSGLALFATPQHDKDCNSKTLEELAAKIALSMGFHEYNFVENLNIGDTFSDIVEEHWRDKLLNFNIVSFWGTIDKIVPLADWNMNPPDNGASLVTLCADHAGICKFGLNQTSQNNLKLV